MAPFDWTVLREALIDLQLLKVTSPPLQGNTPSPSSAAESASIQPTSCLLSSEEFHAPPRSSLLSLPSWPFPPFSLLALAPYLISCFSSLNCSVPPSISFSLPSASLSGAELCAFLQGGKFCSLSLIQLPPGRVVWLCSALAASPASTSSALP